MSENLYTEFRKLSPKVTGGLVRMREETFRDAAVPGKYKILAALAVVVVTKCEPCIKAYTKMAYQTGVTLEELLEFLNVAMTEGGCPGEQWALKAYQTYKELQQGKEIEEELCCRMEDFEK
jgi:AhpD family alkylhydroperoxidase